MLFTEIKLSTLESKIIGGKEVTSREFKDFSYVVYLKIHFLSRCGACLISLMHVLATFQCIEVLRNSNGEFRVKDLTVVVGALRRFADGTPHSVSRIVTNTKSTLTMYETDIAVITVSNFQSFIFLSYFFILLSKSESVKIY